MNVLYDSCFGFILEVDIEYPNELREKHAYFSLAHENAVPRRFKEKIHLNKLQKKKCIMKHRNWNQCIKEGIKVSKIHIEFSNFNNLLCLKST